MKDSRSVLRKQGPTNIDVRSILSYYLPLPGIISILHRISGVVVFLLLPMLIWLLQASLASPDNFSSIKECIQHPFTKFMLWAVLSALIFHLFAGIRHLLMDAGVGETINSAQMAAKVTLVISVLSIIGLGVWLW
jgi:succinate dehydrogenase / fumarate reductase cytochrome b subunit